MSKRYIVDLSSLDPAKRGAAFEQIQHFAFLATRVLGPAGIEAADVIWDSDEDFTKSGLIPAGCRCEER